MIDGEKVNKSQLKKAIKKVVNLARKKYTKMGLAFYIDFGGTDVEGMVTFSAFFSEDNSYCFKWCETDEGDDYKYHSVEVFLRPIDNLNSEIFLEEALWFKQTIEKCISNVVGGKI